MSPERSSTVWSTAPHMLRIGRNEVHVWRASLQCDPDCFTRFEATLSDDEKNRAARFHFAHDQQFFVAGRGILRQLVGAYLKRSPSEVRFQYGPAGKPSIFPMDLDRPIQFNLSRAGGTALFAFACGREVGIDIEDVRYDFASDEIAECFFSANEVVELRAARGVANRGFF